MQQKKFNGNDKNDTRITKEKISRGTYSSQLPFVEPPPYILYRMGIGGITNKIKGGILREP